jgi:hypothetical protein
MNAKDEGAIDALKRDVDRTLLRENLKLTLEQRVQKHLRAAQMMEELQRAGIRLRDEVEILTTEITEVPEAILNNSVCSARSAVKKN